jgi:hypothetical protein
MSLTSVATTKCHDVHQLHLIKTLRKTKTSVSKPTAQLVNGGEAYHPGGYHHVHLGDTVNERYRIIRKFGWGQFSTVWLAFLIVGILSITLRYSAIFPSSQTFRHHTIALHVCVECLKSPNL